MTCKVTDVVLLAVCVGLLGASRAGAQPVDHVGPRGAAMGAFVAVADDASAVTWNPAGLVNGPVFTVVLGFGQSTSEPNGDPAVTDDAAARVTNTLLSLATLPLGISYSRTRLTQLSPVAQQSLGREERQVSVRSLLLSQLGVTVLQSLTEGITVGATAKLVRGNFASGTARLRTWGEGFDRAELLDSEGKTTGDVDVGILAGTGRARVGLVARHLAAPRFEVAGDRLTVSRHVRVGAAWGDGWPGAPRLILAVDADLTRVDAAEGERRDVAAGAERWFRGRTLGVRGGIRASTLGEARALASAGASYALRSGIYLDVYAALGRESDRRWGIAGRLSY